MDQVFVRFQLFTLFTDSNSTFLECNLIYLISDFDFTTGGQRIHCDKRIRP